jgi:hypothetical protein
VEAFQGWRITVEDAVEGAEGRVLLTSSSPVRGKGSGVVVDQRVFTVVALRHKKLTQIDDFSERSQALDAAGLRE